MSQDTIGWVMDKDTSTRRIHLTRLGAGAIGLCIEGGPLPCCVVELDEDGVLILRALLGQARKRLVVQEEG